MPYYYALIGTSRNASGGARWTITANNTEADIIGYARAECEKESTWLESLAGIDSVGINPDADGEPTEYAPDREWRDGEEFAAALEKLNDDGRTYRIYDMSAPDDIAELLDDADAHSVGARAAELVLDNIRDFIGALREAREADAWYEAAAGSDYGMARAWKLGASALVAYGNNGGTDYDITDADIVSRVDELAGYLIHGDLDSLDYAVECANVRGIDSIGGADEYDGAAYAVLIVRSWYGPTVTAYAARGDNGEPLVFDTIHAAQDWIDAENSAPYTLSHNEISRPEYKIINA